MRKTKTFVFIRFLFAGGIIGVIVVFFVLCPYRQSNRVDRGFKNVVLKDVRRAADVEAILGPPGDYSSGDGFYVGVHSGPAPTGRLSIWKDDYAVIHVYYVDEDVVGYRGIFFAVEGRRSWLDGIRSCWRRLWDM